jgi:hypothetical protein
MKKGLKSILFGCHCFFYHPICVLFAWVEIFKEIPNYKELFCIFVHDLGYYNCENIDDYKGQKHPEFGANLAFKLFGINYKYLCLGHSRHYAKKYNVSLSKLFYADKGSMKYDHPAFYLIRTYLSGELKEFMYSDNSYGKNITNKYAWCKNARLNGIKLSINPDSVEYQKEYKNV